MINLRLSNYVDNTGNDRCANSVRENVWNNSKKRKKSRFWILVKKNVKTRMYSFTGHLITSAFNTQLPKVSTGKSLTSNILLGNADTRKYAS